MNKYESCHNSVAFKSWQAINHAINQAYSNLHVVRANSEKFGPHIGNTKCNTYNENE